MLRHDIDLKFAMTNNIIDMRFGHNGWTKWWPG
jgi:hypothetical protein